MGGYTIPKSVVYKAIYWFPSHTSSPNTLVPNLILEYTIDSGSAYRKRIDTRSKPLIEITIGITRVISILPPAAWRKADTAIGLTGMAGQITRLHARYGAEVRRSQRGFAG